MSTTLSCIARWTRGLPGGAHAEVTIAALDRNWANWIREGRLNINGETVIPSVFGDGTGMFGTAVRWKVEVESRAAEGAGDVPLCGPGVAGLMRGGGGLMRSAIVLVRLLLAPILLLAWVAGVSPPGLAAQESQEVARLTGEIGVDPEPGSLLASAARLSVQQLPLAEALVRLAELSRVQIAFSPSLLPPDRVVDCDCATKNIARTLDELLARTDLGYVELGSQVIIVPRAPRREALPVDASLGGRGERTLWSRRRMSRPLPKRWEPQPPRTHTSTKPPAA